MVIKKLLKIAFKNGNFEKTFLYASMVGFSGIHWIGISINAPLLFNEVETIQKKGTITTTAIRQDIA